MDARRRTSDETPTSSVADKEPIWFPTKLSDLDRFKKVFQCGVELEADHPGFQDPVYRERRQRLAQISNNFSLGEKIPRVDYNDVENNTWGVIYRSLKQMHPTHACREYRENFEVFESCVNGFNDKQIPQLEDISEFLFRRTGWRLRPTAGLLAPREFLAGLAFRIFHTTQYIRHSSKPFFTPEPDICHEILGHIPLLADQNFADFSQAIGLASLGASDQDLEKLANCYWFTVEFGLCEEEGQIRAYGAGLLSSFGELQYSLTDQPEKKKFEPEEASITDHPTSAYNPLYFVAESFESAKEKVQKFSTTFGRSFQVHYNPSSQNIDVTTLCT